MAKENIPKFYAALAGDKALTEKLTAADKVYRETHKLPPTDDEAAQLSLRREAVKEIVLPLAAELGLPFTVEEMEAFEKEQIATLQMSDDELDQVAGGGFSFAWGISVELCYTHGGGVAAVKECDTDVKKACLIYGTHGASSTIAEKGFSSSLCFIGGISFS